MTANTRHGPSAMPTPGNDFDLHGVVGIRLADASVDDVATVERQLGLHRCTLDREPDITIRFVDCATNKSLTYAGLGEGGFNEDGFFVLEGKGGRSARARIPFEQIGRHPQVICERAMSSVPHLLTMINLTALAKGVLPLHASAFTFDSTGVLVTGWAKGGKTESLLACMSQGANYVGDEWVYLTEDGQMLGLPEPIRLWSWHLEQMPIILRSRPRRDRLRLSAWKRMATTAVAGSRSRLPGSAVLRKGAPIIGRQAYLRIPPAELFGADQVTLRGRLDVVVLVATHDSPDIVVESAGEAEVSGRMAASLADERAHFLDHYRQFRYAFPDVTSEAVETAEAVESKLLASLLDKRPAAKVLHPYPCDIAALGRAVLSAALDVVHAPVRAGPRDDVPSSANGTR